MTAKPGSIVATANASDTLSLMTCSDNDAMKVKSVNHQNSDFEARPLKIAYFEKHTFIDSPKVIFSTLDVLSLGKRALKTLKMQLYCHIETIFAMPLFDLLEVETDMLGKLQ